MAGAGRVMPATTTAPPRRHPRRHPCLRRRLQATPTTTADPADAAPASRSLKALLSATGGATSASALLDADYLVIGSGIGGLCAGALLSRYGASVTVLEAHDRPGGAAHGFTVGGFEFDAGPSFFAGLSPPEASAVSTNPLAQVLAALGEAVPCVGYDRWVTHLGNPKDGGLAPFPVIADGKAFAAMVAAQAGPRAAAQWARLEARMAPLAAGVSALPAAALRADPGVMLSALRAGDPLALLRAGLGASQLTGPFSGLAAAAGVTDPWLLAWLDLEAFVLSGLPASATIAAEMVFMFSERHKAGPGAKIEYPLGGSAALVSALVRGLEKHGGRLVTSAAVASISLDASGRADGVTLTGSTPGRAPLAVKARKGVISNASAWDTARLLPKKAAAAAALTTPAAARLAAEATATPPLRSFMHLFMGIDAAGLPPGGAEEGHHLLVRDFAPGARLAAPQNVAIVAVPSVFDPSLAPPGCATLHAYTAANEPWELWEGLDRRSDAYRALKEERAAVLWEALERVVAPDVRARAKVSLIGTPLTHARFLRRHRGTYGPAIDMGAGGAFPGPATPVPGLWRCGDSCAPGVGVPAAAASGMILANTLAGVGAHLKMLKEMGA